jgi:hypothetical protein
MRRDAYNLLRVSGFREVGDGDLMAAIRSAPDANL